MRRMKAYAASEGPPPVRKRGIPQAVLDAEEEALGDLLDPWRDRNRTDRNVIGAIKAAWYRGLRQGDQKHGQARLTEIETEIMAALYGEPYRAK